MKHRAAKEEYSNQIPRDGRRTGAAGTEDAGSGHDEHGRIPAEDGAGRLHSAARSARVKRDAFPASLHGQQCQPDCQKSERGRCNRRDGHSRREQKTGADARTDSAAFGKAERTELKRGRSAETPAASPAFFFVGRHPCQTNEDEVYITHKGVQMI